MSQHAGTSCLRQGTTWLNCACLPIQRARLIARGLPPSVAVTIQNGRAVVRAYLLTNGLSLCWNLQELLDKGPSILPWWWFVWHLFLPVIWNLEEAPGAHRLVLHFLKGVCRLRPVVRSNIPSRLSVVPHSSPLRLLIWNLFYTRLYCCRWATSMLYLPVPSSPWMTLKLRHDQLQHAFPSLSVVYLLC